MFALTVCIALFAPSLDRQQVPSTTRSSADLAALWSAVEAVPDPRSLRAFHTLLGEEPHVAGTPGDERTIERITKAFEEMGLEVDVHRIAPLLCTPIVARVEIMGGTPPVGEVTEARGRRGIISLDLRERNLLEDPATAHPDLTWGWNAYSGSGDVTARVVYANYGRREDFAQLREWGIDPRGTIVLARYGGNFRGYKAQFAEEAGAAGLLIYTDPADSGFGRGSVWPDGGWANDTCIQRGSLLTLPWAGDPLTPGVEAKPGAPRLALDRINLPTIPVQPIGYAAAERIIARMTGREVPDPAWRGGIRQTYRLDGGEELAVRVMVEQERAIQETANVVATLRGARYPDEFVVVGCHHDAWGFGAADPLAGTIVLLESARSFADAAKRGVHPERSIVFAAWAAEEFGIIGSTEWVEGQRERLEHGAVAYINLDMAAMGERFGAAASPSLRSAIVAATERAKNPFTGGTILESWRGADGAAPTLGSLGGGSDHVAFWCHAGVPSCSLGAGGSKGSSYHSNYDTVRWYRSVVGEDYQSAQLVTQATNALVASLASGPILPDDPELVIADAVRIVRGFRDASNDAMRPSLEAFLVDLDALQERARRGSQFLARARSGQDGIGAATAINGRLRALRSVWIDDSGLAGRPWFRNLFAAPDRHAGYAPSMLPLIAEAIEDADPASLDRAIQRYRIILERFEKEIDALATSSDGAG